jgi:effector-binding domain-containing protein
MAYQCDINELPARPTLSVHTHGPVQNLPQLLGQAYGAIMQYLGELGEQPVGAPFIVYYNMDMQDLDIEAGFPVARAIPGQGNVEARELPAGKYASCLHTGPYGELGPAYAALTQYVAESGYEPTGVVYEVYLNDPQATAPEQLQTQVLFSLKTS